MVKIMLDGAVCARIYESEKHNLLRIVSDSLEGNRSERGAHHVLLALCVLQVPRHPGIFT